ncbi:hypothetical protein [Leptospira santarosai]|uniref:hypothetical protein n=1 Tax=Leptospira santarosai TaxID=28183 RepID=UPI000A8F2062|nr:hypothetical protein [Leptospira santarosai]
MENKRSLIVLLVLSIFSLLHCNRLVRFGYFEEIKPEYGIEKKMLEEKVEPYVEIQKENDSGLLFLHKNSFKKYIHKDQEFVRIQVCRFNMFIFSPQQQSLQWVFDEFKTELGNQLILKNATVYTVTNPYFFSFISDRCIIIIGQL